MTDARENGRERIRERIERALESDLSYLGNPLRKADPDRELRSSERVEEELCAFEATGLLSQAEAAAWRARFARAAKAVEAPDDEVATLQVRAHAREFLEAHIAELESTGSEGRDPYESARFYAKVGALKSVGALSEQDEKTFAERRDAIVFPEKPATPPTPPPPPELLRVAVGPPERKGGVRVTAAELFTSFVRLWWHRTISPDEYAQRERDQALYDRKGPPPHWQRAAERFELRDDLGTRYEPQLPGSEENTPWLWLQMWRIWPKPREPLPLFGRAVFSPAVPAGATRLEAVSGTDHFTIDLSR